MTNPSADMYLTHIQVDVYNKYLRRLLLLTRKSLKMEIAHLKKPQRFSMFKT